MCSMKLLVGLGNPGNQYHGNRHNVGAMFVDSFAPVSHDAISFDHNEKFESLMVQLEVDGGKWIVLKPQTFMNRSGHAVSRVMQFYKIHPSDVYVAHDDLDISLGKFKILKGVGPKLHNGLLSIEKHIGTADFWRIRIGVENRDPDNRMPGEAYVLQDFTPEERAVVENIFQEITDKLLKK